MSSAPVDGVGAAERTDLAWTRQGLTMIGAAIMVPKVMGEAVPWLAWPAAVVCLVAGLVIVLTGHRRYLRARAANAGVPEATGPVVLLTAASSLVIAMVALVYLAR